MTTYVKLVVDTLSIGISKIAKLEIGRSVNEFNSSLPIRYTGASRDPVAHHHLRDYFSSAL